MDRPPPPRRNRPPPGPSSRASRRRGSGSGSGPGPANGPPPPRTHSSPNRQNAFSPSPSPRPRSKNRGRRRGNPSANYNPNGNAPHNLAPTVAVKLVVRRLPPTLTADKFAEIADPAGASRAVWRSFAPGSASAASGPVKRLRQVTRHATAYLAFVNMDDAVAFTQTFNGIKFQDPNAPPTSQNHDFIARVERAPWQPVPPLTKRTKPLPLHGTIERDPDYMAFVARLEDETKKELSGANALTVAQTSAIFSRGPGSNPSDTQKRDNTSAGVSTSAGKAGALAVNGSELTTPLMEDVRARRKERDNRKKTTKITPRAARGKARHPHPSDSPHKQQTESPGKVTSSMRKKKQRERARASEIANAAKRQEDMQSAKRIGSLAIDSKRGSNAEPRRDFVEPRLTSHLPTLPKTGGHPNGGASGVPTVFTKQSSPRGGSGRSRSGRGRPKGPNMTGPPGAANDSVDSRASVRVLRKDLRNGG